MAMAKPEDTHNESLLELGAESDTIKAKKRVASTLPGHMFHMKVYTYNTFDSLSSSCIRKPLYLLQKSLGSRRDTSSTSDCISDAACESLVAKEKQYLPAKSSQVLLKRRRISRHIWVGIVALLMCGSPTLVCLLSPSSPKSSGQTDPSSDSTNCASQITPSGFQGLLTVDAAYGNMGFSLAKFVDIIWDVVIGRGGQLLIAWIDYRVFSDALMRIMETTSMPYNLYVEMTFSPPSLATLAPIVQSFSCNTSWRHKLLFLWLLLSVLWITSYATIVSAMTGYVANNYALTRLSDDSYVNATIFRSADTAYAYTRDHHQYFITRNSSNATLYGVNQQWTIFANTSIWKDIGSFTRYGAHISYPLVLFPPQVILAMIPRAKCILALDANCAWNDYDVNMMVYYLYNGVLYPYGYENHAVNELCINNNRYRWGFSTELFLVWILLNGLWVLGTYITWVHTNRSSKSELCRVGRHLGRWRAAVDIVEAIHDELGPNISGYTNAELEKILKKRSPVRYVMRQKVDGSSKPIQHLGLSATQSRERLRIVSDQLYDGV